ncbi:MAG: DUF559 domain-containing protein, partial [Anaerolineae bacterium]|nr:DUF559 domain-containing protein [Anaerolineae bacterium]
IVRYMVARVDTVLREELGVAAGLADENVYVLDPCCGTGAYLLETLRHIAATLKDNGGDALLAADLRKAATSRVFGFEIMPAPFVVAQLQIGTLLADLGAPLKQQERAGVYLTNALTGWEQGAGQLPLAGFPELKHEAELSAEVKQDKPILVILGNPPYNGFAGTAMAEERSLSNAYRTTKRAPAPQGQGLNDLYVRFFRMAERRIVEKTGKGVVCFISNYSWLDGLSFTGMRERYLETFDRIWIDNLNGDKYKTGKLTPDGKPDPSIFSTESNPEGIQVGTAIATLVRKAPHTGTTTVNFRHFWGKTKRQQLIEALALTPPALTPGPSPHRRGEPMRNTEKPDTVKSAAALEVPLPGGEGFRVRATPPYTPVTPVVEIGLPFIPATVGANYLAWPRLPDLLPVSFPGVKTSRDDVVVDIDQARLIQRMKQYFDPTISHEQMRQLAPGAMADSARFDAQATRDHVRKRGFLPKNVVRYCYRPFDVRWLYWEPETKLLDEKRADYFPHVFEGNVWLFTTGKTRKDLIEPALFTRLLNDLNCMDSGARGFPLYLKTDSKQASLFAKTLNLSAKASAYLDGLWPSPQTPLPGGEGLKIAADYQGVGLHTSADHTDEGLNDGALDSPLLRGEGPGVRAGGATAEHEKTRSLALKGIIDAARQLRQNQTSAEAVLWECLRDRRLNNLKIRRQHPIKGTQYVADFYCNEGSLIIELDGPIHDQQREADQVRQADIEQLGYRVLRFTNEQVDHHLESVLITILDAATPQSKNKAHSDPALDSPLPGGEGPGVRAVSPLPLGETSGVRAESLFYHAIAIMHAPAYRTENAGALRQDWPRIPLPASAERLTASAQLGRQIAALLDTEHPVDGVTAGKIRDELKSIGAITKVGGGQLNPDTDLTVTAGWGYAGREGVTMPGQGKTKTRDLLPDETAIGDSAQTFDIYLNDVAYWRNVPACVWEYTIGGYQVIKKWLSYREYKVLGRALTIDEAREVTNTARRIAAILLLEDALDDNYAAVKAHTWSA